MGRLGRIYILPTSFGLIFITGALVMILIGATYQNNLVNLLAFFMLSLCFVAMVQTHNNLKDVTLQSIDPENGFAGSEYLVTFTLANVSNTNHFNIEAGLKKQQARSVYENNQPLLAKGTVKLRASYPAKTRGRFELRGVQLSTTYPLGLFRSWIWFESPGTHFIYPEAKGFRPLPIAFDGDVDATSVPVKGGEDFHQHRKYQTGDSSGHIDWKARARGRPLLVKEFNEGSKQSLFLDWQSLEGGDVEANLSQLTAWVEAARQNQVPFGLSLPGVLIPIGIGHAHTVRCLETLAQFGVKRAAN